MCTVSWRAARDGLDLFFNRDELHTRAPELPPVREERDGTAFLAPRDGDHGGTWLAVNAHGLTVCLLNDYANPWRPAPGTARHSRGHLVLACATAASLAAVAAEIARQPLARTLPFTLLAVAPGGDALALRWDGAQLHRRPPAAGDLPPPLSSSSFATDEVIAARLARFAQTFPTGTAPDADALAAYHRQHDPSAGAHSVLMRRPDAATRSLCHVRVTPERVSLAYAPVRPGPAGRPEVLPAATFTLDRRPAGRE
jgi:hypothetical protein